MANFVRPYHPHEIIEKCVKEYQEAVILNKRIMERVQIENLIQ